MVFITQYGACTARGLTRSIVYGSVIGMHVMIIVCEDDVWPPAHQGLLDGDTDFLLVLMQIGVRKVVINNV